MKSLKQRYIEKATGILEYKQKKATKESIKLRKRRERTFKRLKARTLRALGEGCTCFEIQTETFVFEIKSVFDDVVKKMYTDWLVELGHEHDMKITLISSFDEEDFTEYWGYDYLNVRLKVDLPEYDLLEQKMTPAQLEEYELNQLKETKNKC